MKSATSQFFIILIVLCAVALPAQVRLLNDHTYPARSPEIVVVNDTEFKVFWQALVEGHNRILMRTIAKGSDSAFEQIVDDGSAGEHLFPKAIQTASGLHLAWIRQSFKDGKRKNTICYRNFNETEAWGFKEWSLEKGICDGLTLSSDGQSGIRIAYQVKSGGSSKINLIQINIDGEQKNFALKSNSDAIIYSHYPMVFEHSQISILWYQLQEDGRFQLAGASPDSNGIWQPAEAYGILPNLNPLSFPQIVEGSEGQLAALWHEEIDGVERILISRGGDKPNKKPEIIDQRPSKNNRVPTAAISNSGEIAVAWVGETDEGTGIFYRILKEDSTVTGVYPVPANSTYPQIKYTPGGNLVLVWQTDDLLSGAGDIYFTEIR